MSQRFQLPLRRSMDPPLAGAGVLSDAELLKLYYQNNGEPLFPFFVNQRSERGLPSYGLGPCTYDIRLDYKFRAFIDFSTTQEQGQDFHHTIDIMDKDSLFTDEFTVPYNGYFDLAPGGFILAKAMECFRLPRDVMGHVSDKSTYARCGLALQNTIIDPGFEGDLTLEISNHNFRPIRIYPGAGIAQVSFHRVLGHVNRSYADRFNGKGGKYHRQIGVVPPR